MSSPRSLSASIDPRTAGEDHVATLRITNASDAPLEVVNPDMGRPSDDMNWPYSIEVYRASLLMSFGFLSVAVAEESGADVPIQRISTWATPILRPPVPLAPGESVEVPIPIGRFFPLEEGRRYMVSATYGTPDLKVTAEDLVEVRA